MYRRFFHRYLFRKKAVRDLEKEKSKQTFENKGGEDVEFTVNAKQAIAILWTLIAIVLSLIVVLTIAAPYYPIISYSYYTPWQLLVGLFFALLLVITLPIYLLLVLWQALAKSETS